MSRALRDACTDHGRWRDRFEGRSLHVKQTHGQHHSTVLWILPSSVNRRCLLTLIGAMVPLVLNTTDGVNRMYDLHGVTSEVFDSGRDSLQPLEQTRLDLSALSRPCFPVPL